VVKGFWHAHTGWLFYRDQTNVARFTPDLLADRDIARISRQFPLWTTVSLLAPAILGGVISTSFWGALTALFWAGLVRVAVLHHVSWSINSICHMLGQRPFAAGEGDQCLAAGDPVPRRVVAQPAPCQPRLRTPWRRSRAGRDFRPRHLDPGEAGLDARGPVANLRPPGSAQHRPGGVDTLSLASSPPWRNRPTRRTVVSAEVVQFRCSCDARPREQVGGRGPVSTGLWPALPGPAGPHTARDPPHL
jgi:hypothetical protein